MNAEHERYEIRVTPRSSAEEKLASSARKRQQGDIARLLDGRAQTALVRRAHTGQPARHNLPALRDKLREQAHVFVVDRFDLFGAELAHLLAAEKLPSPWTAGAAFASAWARAWWTPLAGSLS